MSTVDQMRAAVLEPLDASEKALDSLAANGARLVLDVVDTSLEPQGVDAATRAQIASGIVEVLDRAIAHSRKTVAFERKLATAMGDPEKLREAAAALAQGVTKAASDLAPRLEGADLEATDSEVWSGNAGYVAVASSQRGALEQVATPAEALGSALTAMSNGIEQYYATLGQLASSTALTLLSLATTLTTWETAVGGILRVSSSLVEIESGLAAMYQSARVTSQSVDALLAPSADAELHWPSSGTGSNIE